MLGLARSGQAAAKLLLSAGGKVVLYDAKRKAELQLVEELKSLPDSCFKTDADLDDVFTKAHFIILSPGIAPKSAVYQKARESSLPIFGELDFASLFADAPMYAVSGTNGKTTTVSLLGDMLSKKFEHVSVAGNIGYPLSSAVMENGKKNAIAVEVSSFQLETVSCFHPKTAVLMNITPDHLDRHGSMEEYIRLKGLLFSQATDAVIINADDAIISSLPIPKDKEAYYFSLEKKIRNGAYIDGGNIVFNMAGKEELLCPLTDIQLLGRHNLQNVLAAALSAYLAGVSLEGIAQSIKNFKAVEHRIEKVDVVDNVLYINDSKGTNPDSTIKAVEAMDRPTVLILGGYDKKISFDSLAQTIKKSDKIKHIVVLGDCTRDIISALEKFGVFYYHIEENFRGAVLKARSLSERGGAVLLSPACASWGMFKNFEERGAVFKQLVKEIKQTNG